MVVSGSLFLIFQSRVVDFAPNQSIEVKKDATEKEALPLNIFFIGDVMLGRAVEERYKEVDISGNFLFRCGCLCSQSDTCKAYN